MINMEVNKQKKTYKLTSRFSKSIGDIKRDMKTRWLAGESGIAIANGYGIAVRTLPFHIGKKTPNEKAMHAKNRAHRIASKHFSAQTGAVATHKNEKKQIAGPESPATDTTDSLSDFIVG